ncbi:MAG: glycosyltransferase [Acidimicrobiales bacterium]|nr:glycosyltransferase [Acidimicrobiales bacterium]
MAPERTGRVLQLLGPSTGGIRRHVVTLTAELRRRGWEVAVAGPAGVLDGVGELDAVVDVPAGSSAVQALRARRQLAPLLRGADLVHAHGLKAGWVAGSLRSRPPLVVTVHNLVLDEAAGPAAPVLRVMEGMLPGRADAVIAVSPGIAERFAGSRAAGRITVVPPVGPGPQPTHTPAETRRALGVDPAAPLVVTVARLHPQKGLDVLLDATAALRERLPLVRLALVGQGPLEQELRDRAVRLGLGGVVVFAGATPNAADQLAAADVVAVPSLWESGPLVVAEALELGRPVVSTPVGFVPELVEDGVSGWLVPIGDAPALAAALQDALTNPSEGARRVAAARTRAADHLDRGRLVDAVAAVYRATLGWT